MDGTCVDDVLETFLPFSLVPLFFADVADELVQDLDVEGCLDVVQRILEFSRVHPVPDKVNGQRLEAGIVGK